VCLIYKNINNKKHKNSKLHANMSFDEDDLRLRLDDSNDIVAGGTESGAVEVGAKDNDGAESVSGESESAEGRWQLVNEFKSKHELTDYLQSYTHKVTATHGKQKSRCNKHPDGHVQNFGYLRCSSVKCVKTPGDCCEFVFKVSIKVSSSAALLWY